MRWSVLVRSFPDNATQRSKILMKRSEVKKLAMASSGDPTDWMTQEVMTIFFTHSPSANGFLRWAFSKGRFAKSAPSIELYEQLSLSSFLGPAFKKSFQKGISKKALKKSSQKELSKSAVHKKGSISRIWKGSLLNRIQQDGSVLL